MPITLGARRCNATVDTRLCCRGWAHHISVSGLHLGCFCARQTWLSLASADDEAGLGKAEQSLNKAWIKPASDTAALIIACRLTDKGSGLGLAYLAAPTSLNHPRSRPGGRGLVGAARY